MIFCDTSAAAKFYSTERESSAVKALFEAEDEVCISELARVEIMSVFHRRLRERIWDYIHFQSAVSQFSKDDLTGFWTWLPLDKEILNAAAAAYVNLPSTVFLRASDCIHLATAIRHDFEEIYTHDRHQSSAASVLGLKAVSVTT